MGRLVRGVLFTAVTYQKQLGPCKGERRRISDKQDETFYVSFYGPVRLFTLHSAATHVTAGPRGPGGCGVHSMITLLWGSLHRVITLLWGSLHSVISLLWDGIHSMITLL